MIRAVLDANVFVSAVLNPMGTPARLYTLWHEGRYDVLMSAAILEEMTRVLRYPKIAERHGWSEPQLLAFIEDIVSLTLSTPGALTLTVIQDDPADNRYLECAVEGHAEVLVTGDRLLLNLDEYQGVIILTPRAFLDMLQRSYPFP
jgi:putative PIN family toxin of toxin-antitoxin system